MTKTGSILRRSGTGWQITAATSAPSISQTIHGPGKVEANSLAKKAAEFVASHGLSQNIALAIDSKSTLAAKFTVANSAELRDRRVMSYKVEELLPLAAEDFAADYINEGNQVLGIATPIRDFLPVVTALEEQGLQIQSISPRVVSAMQAFLEKQGKPSCDYILWQDGDSLELFRLGRQITEWRHLPAKTTAIKQQLSAILLHLGAPVKIALFDVDSNIQNQISEMTPVAVEVVESHSLDEYARQGAMGALNGSAKPWVELCRDRLQTGDPQRAFRREKHWCYGALAFLLVSASIFCWMRSWQYKNEVTSIQQQQEALFQQLYPAARVPNAVLSRLKSERSKLLGARGDDAAVEQPYSALNVLHALLTGMPEELRLQVQQLRVEDGKIYLDVNVRSVGDAGELASALEQHGFSMEPPTTEQYDSKQVSVRINGKRIPQPSGSGL